VPRAKAGLPSGPVSFRPEAVRGVQPGGPGAIDYRLMRRSIISEFRKGRLAEHEVCDAQPELMRAAQNCGRPTAEECPICEEARLVLVSFVFGSRLPAHGRCITSDAELAQLNKRADSLACYVVEVCPECAWNHLARTYLLGRAHSR
jgi:hypothetical protein